MKKLLTIAPYKPLILIVFLSLSMGLFAQYDQNPRYKESLEKYKGVYDSINQYQAGTLQQAYKAYDWYEAKIEARALRRKARLERRNNRSKRRVYRRPYYSNYNSPFNNSLIPYNNYNCPFNNYYNPYPYYDDYGYYNNNGIGSDIGTILWGGLTTAYILDLLID